MKITKILLWVLLITLPLVHGRIFETLGFDIWLIVSGNFEFTKALYFNVFASLIFIVFCFEHIVRWGWSVLVTRKEKIVLFLILSCLSISTFFSLSPFNSLIWDLQKWHTFIMYLNIIWLYIILRQLKNKDTYILLSAIIAWWILTSLIAIKELHFASFDYGALWSRALWSFGHPNYLSGYILILLPVITIVQNPYFRISLTALFLGVMIQTGSLTWVFLFLWYLIYIRWYFSKRNFCILAGVSAGIWIMILSVYFPEKIHSFLSRFYLWESVIRIYITSPINSIFWYGLESLPYYFNSYKVPELYIFENFWYSADRPHNFMLSILYHLWVFWISLLLYCFFLAQKKYRNIKNITQGEFIAFSVIILFLLQWVFHYFSIASYVAIAIVITLLFSTKNKTNRSIKYRSALNSIFHPHYFLKFWEFQKAGKLEWILSERNIKTQLTLLWDSSLLCENLTSTFPSVENYFYCWDILEKNWEIELSIEYHAKWLSKLPDLWNDYSPYWNNYFIKHTITGNRFFSEKFWDIWNILEKIDY